jgi:hypothetical protein
MSTTVCETPTHLLVPKMWMSSSSNYRIMERNACKHHLRTPSIPQQRMKAANEGFTVAKMMNKEPFDFSSSSANCPTWEYFLSPIMRGTSHVEDEEEVIANFPQW